MKTLHGAVCECCPAGPGASMTVWADAGATPDTLTWGVEDRCAANHHILSIDADALFKLHQKEVDRFLEL